MSPCKETAQRKIYDPTNPDTWTYTLSDLKSAIDDASEFRQVRIPKSRENGPLVVRCPSFKGRENSKHYSTPVLEGRSERDGCWLFEFDPSVVYYKPQPFRLWLYDGFEARHYTPDFLIFYRDQPPALAEVKPERMLRVPETANLMRVMEKACRKQGFGFLVITSEEASKQPRRDNLSFLYPYLSEDANALPSLLKIVKSAGRPVPLRYIQTLDPSIGPSEVAVGLKGGFITTSHNISWGPLFNIKECCDD